jgi:hypothetical protein
MEHNKRQDIKNALKTALSKKAAVVVPSPTDADLRRMYDVIQADARLTHRVAGLGFGNSGDAYRKAAIKLRIMELMNVLRDGKNIRNDIVHKPGYIPSEQSTRRALEEYAKADSKITEFLQGGRQP